MNVSQLSQLLHYIRYRGLEITQTYSEFEKGMLIISIDIDAGNTRLAIVNAGRNDAYVNNRLSEYEVAKIEEIALPLFMKLFEQLCIPVTVAVRGQLLDVDESALAPILLTSVKHDVASHGYSHRSFTDLSPIEAENELNMISVSMNRLGIVPKSFIFPKNKVAYLSLLEKHGYRCYRDRGGFILDGLYIKKQNHLYDIHPGLHFRSVVNLVFPKKILDICVNQKLPLHIWFHTWRFGSDKKSIQESISKFFLPFLEYAREKVDDGEMTFETMLSSIDKLKMANGKHLLQ